MTSFDSLLLAISATMDAPELVERATSFVSIARISLLIALGGFLMLWRSIERQLVADIASRGDLHWSFWQSFRVAGLVFLSATLLDASLLSAAMGEPAYLIASQAIQAISDGQWPAGDISKIESDQRVAVITEAVRGLARSSILHAGACLAAGLAIVICIARRATPSFEAHRSSWFGLALMLGLFGWPSLSDGASWSAIFGDIEPFLRATIAY